MLQRLLLTLCLLCFAGAVPAYASDLQPGFRTLGVWEPEKKLRLNLAVWYPVKRTPFLVDYGEWTFRAARNAPPVPGRHPLIVLSHDSAGSRFSLHELGAALARNGFVAVAATHPGDNIEDMSALFTLPHLAGRAADISATIDVLLENQTTEPMLDPQRIGVLGVGPGGTAALLVAGGRLDASDWPTYCAKAELARQGAGEELNLPDPLYCAPWSARRMAILAADPGLSANHRDRRVRVAAAVAPWYGMLFTPRSLSRIRIPIMLMAAEKDTVNPVVFHVEAIRKALPTPPAYATLKDADTAALLSPCSQSLSELWPELCMGATESRRERVQEALADEASRFFLAHLGTPNPPPLPPEPPEEPAQPEQEKVDKQQASQPARASGGEKAGKQTSTRNKRQSR